MYEALKIKWPPGMFLSFLFISINTICITRKIETEMWIAEVSMINSKSYIGFETYVFVSSGANEFI